MTVTETLGALGSWSLQLAEDAPDEVLRQLGYFGHIVILRGDVDVTQAAAAALLQQARYVGVLRAKPTDAHSLEGSGMRFWLGDEDGKGKVRETKLFLNAQGLSACVTAALSPAVHAGTINSAAGTYTGSHQWETPRQTLDTITTAFGVEYRVNGDATVDVGTQAQLYRATPNTILSARGAGADLDVASIGTDFRPGSSAVDYSTRVVLLGQTTDQQTIVEATADAPTVPYLDMWGNVVAFTRAISDSGQTTGSASASAALNLNRFNRTTQAIKVTAEDYNIQGTVVVGDNVWVYDPDNGIVDASRELDFHGEKINPAVVRISGATWPVTREHTVCFRTQSGTIIDLTRWVLWESGTTDLTIGDLPKTLTTGGNPVQDRTQSTPDASVPNPPTGLTLTTAAVQSSKGNVTATISASWTAPPLNTDGSVVTDLSNYLVQYRWQGRAPLWTTLQSPVTTIDIPGLSVGLIYDVQVAAVDLAGHVSAFTAVSSITGAPDSTAPNPPSDPVVTSYLGQLRVAWDGKDNAGAAMPPDFAIVEVHVSATSGFTPVSGPGSTTLVSQLSTAGVAYATAPYGASRFVKLVSVDNSGNRSAPSGQVTGSTVQVADGDIAALNVGKLTAGTMSADVVVGGRFATALTGARVEMNSLGFQKFDTDGVTKLVSITGTEALLTGLYKSAATGRRIELGAAGTLGELDFYAPDGTKTYVRAFTESAGIESIQLGMPAVGTTSLLWNKVHVNSDEWTNISARNVDICFGKATGQRFLVAHTTDKRATNYVGRFMVDGATLAYWDSTSTERLSITDSNLFTIWDATGVGRFQVTGTSVNIWDAGSVRRFGFDNGSTWVFSPNACAVAIVGGSATQTAWIRQFTSGGYGTAFITATDDSVGTNARTELKWWDGSFWTPMWASAYVVPSDEALKTDIADFDGATALEHVRSMRPRTYRRKVASGPPEGGPRRSARAKPGPVELGLVAQEVPAAARGDGGDTATVNLYPLIVMAIAALKRVDERLTAVEGAA